MLAGFLNKLQIVLIDELFEILGVPQPTRFGFGVFLLAV